MSTNPSPYSGSGGGITPPAGDIGGTTAAPTVVSTHLSAALPIAQGGTAATTAAAALADLGGMGLQATTGAAGFALQNGTPNILTWTPPNDGAVHRALLVATLTVATTETGGRVDCTFNNPANAATTVTSVIAGALSGGASYGATMMSFTLAGGTAFVLKQGVALTAGAATIYAEIWGL